MFIPDIYFNIPEFARILHAVHIQLHMAFPCLNIHLDSESLHSVYLWCAMRESLHMTFRLFFLAVVVLFAACLWRYILSTYTSMATVHVYLFPQTPYTVLATLVFIYSDIMIEIAAKPYIMISLCTGHFRKNICVCIAPSTI